jgi:sec-independent protein translocase protein TatA
MPFGLQPWHLIAIAAVALLLFGPQRLPEIGRGLGKSINEFRAGAKEMTQGFQEEIHTAEPEGSRPTSIIHSPEEPSGVFCTACGSANPAGSRYCSRCGKSMPD